MELTAEETRLREAREGVRWRQWGPYLSERQWGTVREDYSDNGDAWNHFTHDQARSRAYRWGEDGMAGVSDDKSQLLPEPGPVERARPDPQGAALRADQLRGQPRGGRQGVLLLPDNTPTHSWMRWRYKYPHAAFPYDDLVRTNAERGFHDAEYELLDTGVFDEGRYFDVEVDYAKAGPSDLLARVTVRNRGPQDAPVHLLPTLWFRNTWSWGRPKARPTLASVPGDAAGPSVHARPRRPSGSCGCTWPSQSSCCSARTRPTPSGSPASRTPRRTRRTA